MGSVLKHLQRILNTRQGSVPIAPDYGMPDFTNIDSTFGPSDVPIMERTLASVISKYEPRLSDVQVRFTPAPDRPLTAVFTLSARLLLPDAATPVLFETVLNPDGHIQVSE